MKRIIFFMLAVSMAAMSCSDFLEEEYLSGENSTTITQSEQGMESLVSASYIFLRVWYGKENQWDLTESGTDLYTRGLDNRSAGFCTYNRFVGEEQDREPDQHGNCGDQAANDVSPHGGSLRVKRRRRPLSLTAKGAATDALVRARSAPPYAARTLVTVGRARPG